ncbi:MAG: ABC transporter substrate-binding protein [Dehalococcoidia bacterium]
MRILYSVGLVVALMVSGCAPAAPSAAPASNAPAERRAAAQNLKIGVKGLFGNPTPQSSATLHYLFYPLYDNLTAIGEDYLVKPSVAEKWELRPDGAWRFTLRRDMTWPDGSKLTSSDVKFTVDTILDKKWPQRSYLTSVEEATIVDEYTVDLRMKHPDMSIPAAGNFIWIVPKVYFEQVGFDAYVQKPVGSGPYELVSFRNATSVQYRKRSAPHAFRRPIADEVSFTVIGENAQLVNGIRTGEIDLVTDVAFSADHAQSLKAAGFDLYTSFTSLQYIMFPQGVNQLRETPLTHKQVRQALAYAINREALAGNLFKGYAKPAYSLAVPGTGYYDPSIAVPAYDPAKAKQLLAAAGYPNGFRLPTGLDYNTAFTSQDVIVAIQANLRAVGVEFEVIANERGVAVDKAYGRNNLMKGEIWVATQGDPLGFGGSRTFIGCDKPVGNPLAENWCNPEWDRLMDFAYADKDETSRAQTLKRAARLQADDAVYQALYLQPLFTVGAKRVRNARTSDAPYYNFDPAYLVE